MTVEPFNDIVMKCASLLAARLFVLRTIGSPLCTLAVHKLMYMVGRVNRGRCRFSYDFVGLKGVYDNEIVSRLFTSSNDRPRVQLPYCSFPNSTSLPASASLVTDWRWLATPGCMAASESCDTSIHSGSCIASGRPRTCMASPFPFPVCRDMAPVCQD
jgi:hypothetical protein